MQEPIHLSKKKGREEKKDFNENRKLNPGGKVL